MRVAVAVAHTLVYLDLVVLVVVEMVVKIQLKADQRQRLVRLTQAVVEEAERKQTEPMAALA
jgi:hypothetical protein